MGQPAHAEVGHTRHRCKKSAPAELHSAYLEVIATKTA
jgi:hypothetical protein